MSDNMRNVIKNVDYLRNQRKWTLEETAEKADMPFPTLNAVMYGNSKTIMLSTIERLARAFGITVAEMLVEQNGAV